MPVRFGLLQRHIFGQLFRTFALALVTITAIFTLGFIVAEATRHGLNPQEVLGVLPFLVPGSLPYTAPAAVLFAVTVVYGRIAADNEVMAVKAAGLSIWAVLNPALLLGIALSACLFAMSSEVIPRANNAFRQMIFGSISDGFFRFLKKERELNNPAMPFYIQVRDIKGRTLIDPLFKHRAPSPPNPQNTFDLTVSAKTATVDFDLEKLLVTVELENAETSGQARDFLFWIDGKQVLQYPFPKPEGGPAKRVQEMTGGEILQSQAEYLAKLRFERKRQAMSAGLWLTSGHIERVEWPKLRGAQADHGYWRQKYHELETEKHLRVALAAGGFFFVLLGAPVGILFAKRDFLSAFITCFVPIIVLYYPLTLAAVNLGKEAAAPPQVVFAANGLLGLLAGFFALPPVRKH
jgi:lipopolysaccharide export system permease protein